MRYDELSPGRLIDQLRAWFHARDRSVVLDDGTFLEVPEMDAPGTPPSGRSRIYSLRDTPGWGLYHQDDQGRERQFSGDMMAWQTAVSTILALPGLRAFWPMSSIDYTNPQVRDISGSGYNLTNNNTATFGYDSIQTLVPCAFLDGTNQYLSRADGGAVNWADITGTETYIENTAVGARGLTIGGWFRLNSIANSCTLACKWRDAGANQRGYLLFFRNTPRFEFITSVDGTATFQTVSSVTPSANSWYFVVGRFDPSAEGAVFVNDVQDTNVVAVPASIFDNTADFTIGVRFAGTDYMPGRISLVFLCAAKLDDATISSTYQQTRGAFGV